MNQESTESGSTRRMSKFLSLVLRHKPQEVGVELDESGWVDVEILLASLASHPAGRRINHAVLERVVMENDKQRFEFNPGGDRIRARQGHSVEVDLGYEPATPPEMLWHGTPAQFVDSIRKSGLKKMNRHHVHLHVDVAMSQAVGARRGQPVLLAIRAGDMHRAGHVFFVTANQVWLTDHVPVEFIEFTEY